MTKILIVGAGPTGLTAAVELARQGVIPTVIDEKTKPSQLSRAVGILPRSLELLELSGVTERLLDEGIHIDTLQFYRGDRPWTQISLRGGHSRYPFLVALAQDRTEAALRETFAQLDGTVQYGVECLGLEQAGGQVVVRMSEQRVESFDLVLGADGSHSAVRETLGVDFEGYELDAPWSIADVESSDWPHPDRFTISIMPSGDVAVAAPLERNRYRLVSNTADAQAAMPIPFTVERVRRAATFQISVRQVPRYQVGNVFLAGDAAHCHSPVGGRGMNLGIDDAVEWAHRFTHHTLDGYSASRHAVGKETIRTSERARKLVTNPSYLRRVAVAWGLRVIAAIPPLRRRAAQQFLGG